MFARNVRFAFRLLRKNPVFALTAVTTLALCIGVNTAVFSLVDAVLFRPLPYPEPERLAQVVVAFEQGPVSGEQQSVTGQVWEAVRDHVPSVRSAVLSDWITEVNLAGEGRVQPVRQQRVCAGFFGVLGVTPLVGREFTAEEDRRGGPPVVVLAHDLWERVFDRDRSVVGRTVLLRGLPHTIVGIMPAGFRTSSRADVWTPLAPSTTGEGGGSNYTVIGRLKPGVSWLQADTQMAGVSQQYLRNVDLPRDATSRIKVVPLQAGLAADLRTPLLLLWSAVGVVLLIGCSNVAGLLLARSASRTREIATRVALGGGPRAVVAQLLTESLVLALLGGIAGLVVGQLVLVALRPTVVKTLDVWQTIGLDWRVLTISLAVATFTSVLFGLLPALRAARTDVRSALIESGGRRIAGGSRLWPRRLLVTAQVALGLALLVGAGLLIRTFDVLNNQAPGFDPTNVVTAQVSLQDARYTTAARAARLFDESLRRIVQLPGVEAAGVGLSLPYERALNLGFQPTDGRRGNFITNLCYVTPGYFRALRMSVLRGRQIAEFDGAGSAPVAVVNEAFVRRYYPRRELVRETLRVAGSLREVIALVRDVPHQGGWGDFGPIAAMPTIYVPAAQMPDAGLGMIHTWFSPHWVVRTAGDPTRIVADMKRAVEGTDPLLVLTSFRSIDEVRADALASQRLRAELVGGLAALALGLTFVGVYGLVAHTVAERSHEIGIRMALGATARLVLRDVAGQSLLLGLAGVAIGGGLAWLVAPLLRRLVWGVSLLDPLTFAAAGVSVLLLVGVASLVPALRVTRLDPAHTLRSE